MGLLEAAVLFFVALWREKNYDMHNFEMKMEIKRLVRIIKTLEKRDEADYLIDDWDDRKNWFANDGIDYMQLEAA
jgi:hypothetical protein